MKINISTFFFCIPEINQSFRGYDIRTHARTHSHQLNRHQNQKLFQIYDMYTGMFIK